jgi:copper chaperone CopZ
MTRSANEMSNWVAWGVAVTLVACLGGLCSGCAPSAAGPASASSSVPEGTQTLEFSVEGMICPRCEPKVADAVKVVPGVKSVEVSFEAKKATLVADLGQVSAAAVEKAVADAGFTAKLIPSESPGD